MIRWGIGVAFLMAFSLSGGNAKGDMDWKQADYLARGQAGINESAPGA